MWINLSHQETTAIIASFSNEPIAKDLSERPHRDEDKLLSAALRKFDNEDVTPHELTHRTINGGYVVGSFWVTNEEAGIYADPALLKISNETKAKIAAIDGFHVKQIALNDNWAAKGRLGDRDWEFEFDGISWSFGLLPETWNDDRWIYTEDWKNEIDPSDLADESGHDQIMSCILLSIDNFSKSTKNQAHEPD
ncbi:hypothetical protein AB4Z52_22810 [Rhizobium sp. 2YAF20]|uniref:hypothetical protein n=1 Tax=Rhizobium sp. 2YAF20 TaxID=3233027 RepID=UPI003F968CF3